MRRTSCPRLVGYGRATELLMLGDTIDAETADRYGLVTQLHRRPRRRRATRWPGGSPTGPTLGLQQTKSLITRELDMPLGPAMELDAMTQALLMTTRGPRGVPRRVQRQAQARLERALSIAHDFLQVDDLLTDEDRAIRDTVRDFAQSELAPHVAEWYDEGTLPDDLGPVFGKLGLLGMHLDGYGCAGTSATAYGVACRELEAVDSGLRSFVSVQGSLAMYAIHRWGTDEHKDEWLPRMATGEAIGCFGLTEPDAGSDPGSMKTRARRRTATDWVLNGSKMWITNGTFADVAVVWAQTDDGDPRLRRSRPTRRASAPTRSSASSRCAPRSPPSSPSTTCGCRPTRRSPRCAGSRVRSRASTRRATASSGAWSARPAPASRSRWPTRMEREQFGKPLASFQLTQRKLALMTVAVNNASLVAWRLGALKDAGTLTPIQVSYGKYANVRAALDVAREARTTLGGAGHHPRPHGDAPHEQPRDRDDLRGHRGDAPALGRCRAHRHPGVPVTSPDCPRWRVGSRWSPAPRKGIGAACALRAVGRRAPGRSGRPRRDGAARRWRTSLPGESLVVPADLLDPGAIDAAFARVEEEWGPVEILVVNAGASMSAPLVRTTDEDWQRMLDLNLTAPFRCLRRALPAMTEAGFGRVVVIASVAGKVGAPGSRRTPPASTACSAWSAPPPRRSRGPGSP